MMQCCKYSNQASDKITFNKADISPSASEETKVTAVTSVPLNELEAWDSFHPMIHSALNDTSNVIYKPGNPSQKNFLGRGRGGGCYTI